mmetsp:Transcript_39478/g.114289  ORF Transcript_39478/g.114289 Transcript_39478/m.114289 type:complete len:465 (+) Transcript_39478:201-1595(+)
MDEVVENVHAQTDAVLGAQGFDELEAPLRPPAPVGQLDEHGQGECARPDPNFLHLCQDGHAPVPHPVASASVDQRVVSNLIRAEAIHLLHVFQKLECPVHAILLAIPLDDGAVSDDVGLDALRSHCLQQAGDPPHVTAPGTSVHQGVEGHDRAWQLVFLQLLVDLPNTVKPLPVREAFQHRAKNHRIDQRLHLGVLQLLADEIVRVVDVAVRCECLDHAPEGDTRRQDPAPPHVAPSPPDAVDVVQGTVCTDEAAERVRALDLHRLLALELLSKQVDAARADACLAHRAEEHLVDGLLHRVHDSQGLFHLLRPGRLAHALEHNGASHVVRPATARLHLPHDTPDRVRALRDGGVEELIEGDAVRLEAALAHRLDALPGAAEAAVAQVGLDHRVECHNVRHLGFDRLGHQALGPLVGVVVYACIQEGVVDAAGFVVALVENRETILQAAGAGAQLDQATDTGAVG